MNMQYRPQPSPMPSYFKGESLPNSNPYTIGVSGKNSNMSSAIAFHLCSYITLCSKRVFYLAILTFIYDILMKSKCQIVKSGSCCSFGSDLLFVSMSLQLLSFFPSFQTKYIETSCNLGKIIFWKFLTSHTKLLQALQLLQGG